MNVALSSASLWNIGLLETGLGRVLNAGAHCQVSQMVLYFLVLFTRVFLYSPSVFVSNELLTSQERWLYSRIIECFHKGAGTVMY